MPLALGHVSIVVADYDEAVAWYTQKLGFKLVEDSELGGGKRWVVVAPETGSTTRLLLARAASPQQSAVVGKQAGGRVFPFSRNRRLRARLRGDEAQGRGLSRSAAA